MFVLPGLIDGELGWGHTRGNHFTHHFSFYFGALLSLLRARGYDPIGAGRATPLLLFELSLAIFGQLLHFRCDRRN